MQKRRVVSLAAASLVIGSLAGLSVGGCADTEGTFYVLNAIPGKVEDNFCIYDPAATPLLSGAYEILGGDEYDIGLIAHNSLISTENGEKPQVETNHVEIYAIDVELEGKGINGAGDCPSSFTYPAKGFVEPGTEGATRTLVIPACTRSQLNAAMAIGESQTVIATFIVHGHTTGGDEVESPEYEFPIHVYRGAYCNAPVADDAPAEEEDSAACGFGVNTPAPYAVCKENQGP